MKSRGPSSTLKKVVVLLLDRTSEKGYLNPGTLGQTEAIDLLTLDGEHQAIELEQVKCVYFVREFNETFELERKTFLSRPKLDGLWVRLRFRTTTRSRASSPTTCSICSTPASSSPLPTCTATSSACSSRAQHSSK